MLQKNKKKKITGEPTTQAKRKGKQVQDISFIENLAHSYSYAKWMEESGEMLTYSSECYTIKETFLNPFLKEKRNTRYGSYRQFDENNPSEGNTPFRRKMFHNDGIYTFEHPMSTLRDEKAAETDWDKLNEYSGYTALSIPKAEQMMLYFAQQCRPFVPKMSGMLFFSDFLCFKRFVASITGIHYKAMPNGATPEDWETLYNTARTVSLVESVDENGMLSQRFVPREGLRFDPSLFNEQEISVINDVSSAFRDAKTEHIISLSRNEMGWINNIKRSGSISYSNAFELKAF